MGYSKVNRHLESVRSWLRYISRGYLGSNGVRNSKLLIIIALKICFLVSST